jgi:hypothetical protein
MEYKNFVIIERNFLIRRKYLHDWIDHGGSMLIWNEEIVIKPDIVARWLEAADVKIRNNNIASFV